jgi:hypothetical protein
MRVLARLEVRLRFPTELELVVGRLLPELRLDVDLLGLRPDVTLLGLRLDVIVLERLVVGARLVVTLLGLRLDVILLGLRLDVIVRDRELVGVLLVDILRELLRLGVLDLVGVRTERELTLLLRLLPALADALDLEVEAGLEACVFALLLRDDPLFFELFAAKTGSVARAKSKKQEAITNNPSRRYSAILIFDI